VAVAGLPQPVFLDHGVTGAAGTSLWLALRPEKLELHKHAAQPPALGDAPPGHNVVAGTISHIAYLGSESLYEVTLADGQRLKALRSNLTRWDQEDFQLHEPVWLAWHACSPAVLLS
ncbi:MAG: TOBE domain-containing protein, partial [Sphingomonadales bacterium]